jgi:hypothetical protein
LVKKFGWTRYCGTLERGETVQPLLAPEPEEAGEGGTHELLEILPERPAQPPPSCPEPLEVRVMASAGSKDDEDIVGQHCIPPNSPIPHPEMSAWPFQRRLIELIERDKPY